MNVVIIFLVFFGLRLVSLAFSIRNEKRLIAQGAKQYGARNSLLLTLAHVAYYASALTEASLRETTLDTVSLVGVGIMTFAYAMLFYVIYRLRDIWTVKLYIAPEHRIERSFLFRVVRHPNYYLNILPELLGVALLCHAWITLALLMPVYILILAQRIRLEEAAMADLW